MERASFSIVGLCVRIHEQSAEKSEQLETGSNHPVPKPDSFE
jgi:hypothetical protein